MVIKKIQSHNSFDYLKVIKNLSDIYDFLFCNNILYLALKSEQASFPSKLFKNCFITDYEERYESQNVRDWATSKLMEAEKKKFEEQEQDRLKALLFHLNEVNQEVDKYLFGKEGENA